MITIAIAEDKSNSLRNALTDALRRKALEGEVFLCRAAEETPCDILLCSNAESLPSRIIARALVVGETAAAEAVRCCGADTVITCGLNSRNTLTPSSLLEGGGMATLQRETPTLSGGICLPLEIPLDGLSGPMEQKLMLVAALLLMQ